MDTELIMAALWFILGAMSYKLVAYLMNYGRAALMIQHTVFGLLLMLKYYDKVFQAEKDKIVQKVKEDAPRSHGDSQITRFNTRSMEISKHSVN